MIIAGVDEAGRGPLAGPVVAAAVILCGKDIRGLGDSKTLPFATREKLYARIRERCHVGVGIASVEEIDALNILRATMLAMTRAVAALGVEPSECLIDGDKTPHRWCDEWRWPARSIVKGDAKKRCISAASIIAKQTRDRLMVEAEDHYPGYGFARHKGYGTQEHRDAIVQHGPCPLHRRSFAPIAQYSLF